MKLLAAVHFALAAWHASMAYWLLGYDRKQSGDPYRIPPTQASQLSIIEQAEAVARHHALRQ